MDDVIIFKAKRTAIGKLGGCLSHIPAHQLAANAIRAVVDESSPCIQKGDVTEVIFGNVLSAGCGMNGGRQASLAAGLPPSVPASTINMVCGSGLKAIVNGSQCIRDGGVDVVVAGGMESMSRAPHMIRLRIPQQNELAPLVPPMLPALPKFGDTALVDSLMNDGLTDPVLGCLMGDTAELVAFQHHISRSDQDMLALRSHSMWAQARSSGRFESELIGVTTDSKGSSCILDELPRTNLTLEKLAKLPTVFNLPKQVTLPENKVLASDMKYESTITAGNCSGLNDGAAAVMLASASFLRKRGAVMSGLSRLVSWAQSAGPPEVMGIEPIAAVRQALTRAGWKVEEVDMWEINEAFAATTIVVIKELGIPNWEKRVNINGGAIAMGHPLGATGARLVVTLSHQLALMQQKEPTKVFRGVATACIGGGQAIAACLESLPPC